MTSHLVTTTLKATSGLPEDDFVNSWAFTRPLAPTQFQVSDLATAFDAFYTGIFGYISQAVTRTAFNLRMRVYDISAHLGGTPHGSPTHTEDISVDGAALGINMPGEVAMALTLRAYAANAAPPAEAPDGADPGIALDRPRQRRSGRVYIGPLTTQAVTADINGAARPSLNFRTDLLDGIDALQAAALIAGWTLGVWSRKDAVVTAAVHASVDDAFDSQRRRGPDPTARTLRAF